MTRKLPADLKREVHFHGGAFSRKCVTRRVYEADRNKTLRALDARCKDHHLRLRAEFARRFREYETNPLFRMTENVGSFDIGYAETALMVALSALRGTDGGGEAGL